NADTSAEIDAAFEAMGRDRPDAVIVGTTPFLNGRRVQLAQVAAFNRLPAIYTLRESVEVGGLMSYGSNIVDAYRQVGVYVGRILKGAKPGELPIVQATKFELVINAPTARMLGLTIPTQPRRRGDRLSWQCPLLALSGHRLARCTCLLLTQSGHQPALTLALPEHQRGLLPSGVLRLGLLGHTDATAARARNTLRKT
ncbi:MAG: ABC transporter substrate binding protein, partial [Pseudolabrys sp.]